MSSSLTGTFASPAHLFRSLAILAASALPLLSTSALADFEEFLVNDDIAGEESRIDPVAIRLDNGGYVTFWADNGRGHTDVFARAFDEDFSPLEAPYRVNTDDGLFSHRELDVSQPGGGVFLIVWEDERTGETDLSIYGRLYSSETAMPITPDIRIDGTLGFGPDVQPRVHTSPDGESLVVWVGRVNQTNRIVARRIGPDGSFGPDFLPTPENPGLDQSRPAVTRTPDGRWVLAWQEEDAQQDTNIFYRFLGSDGTPQGSPARANSDILFQNIQREPEIELIGSRLLVVWNDSREGFADVWGLWVQLDGTPDGTDRTFRPTPDGASDRRPRIHTAVDGTFAISWFGGLEDRQRAMVQYYDLLGELVVEARVLDDPPSGISQRQPFIVSAEDGSWWEFWSDDRTGAWNCFTQRFSPTGGELGDEVVLYSNPVSSSQMYADAALFPDGGAVLAWADFRDGSLAIYARLLDAAGEPDGPSFRVGSIPANVDLTTVDAHETVVDYAPSIAAGANGFVVTWAINQLGERLNYYAQFFDRSGVRIGENFLVAPADQELPQRDARPAMLPDGGFAIAFEMTSPRGQGSDSDVFLQLFASDGLPTSRVTVANAEGLSADQVSPSIAVSSGGTIYVGWLDRRAGGWDIMAQRFSRTGERIGDNVFQHAPDEPTSDQLNVSAGIAPDRTVTVFENRPLTLGQIDGRLEIFATAAAGGESSGGPLTGGGSEEIAFTVNAGREARGIKLPQVEMAPDGRFIVTWWENTDGQTQLLAQRYSARGEPVGVPYPIHGNGVEGSRLQSAVSADNDRIQYAWADSRRSKGWDVRSRLVDWEFEGAPTPVLLRMAEAYPQTRGVELRWETGFELGFHGFFVHRQIGGETPSRELLPGAVQLTPELLPAERDGLYSFLDEDAPALSRLEYFLEAVDVDGGTELFGPLLVTTGEKLVASAWPNPFRDSIVLSRRAGDPVDIELFDAAGRLVRVLRADPGEESVTWDGRDARGADVPTGVYFARPRNEDAETIRLIRLR